MTHDEAPAVGELRELAPGTYAYLQSPGGWWVNNVGIVGGADGTVLVDTCATERRNRELRRALQTIDAGEPCLVINTHEHGDHTNGNASFPEARVVAHRRCREGMEASYVGGRHETYGDVDWGHLRQRLPEVTFEDALQLHVGGRELRLSYFGPAHTHGDIVVEVPDVEVWYVGDLVFHGSTPLVLMGAPRSWLHSLRRLRAREPRVVVPGHGRPGGIEIADGTEEYLTWLVEAASEVHRRGLSPLEGASAVHLGPFADWPESERLVANLWAAYAEIDQRTLTSADLAQAMADMVTFNGGPLACYA